MDFTSHHSHSPLSAIHHQGSADHCSPGGGHHTPLGQGDGGVGQPAGQPPRVLAEVARGAVVAVRHPAPIVGLETCNIGDDAITATALNI